MALRAHVGSKGGTAGLGVMLSLVRLVDVTVCRALAVTISLG